MDATTALNLIAFGFALNAENNDVVFKRMTGRTMPREMKLAFRELKEHRKPGPATKHWMMTLDVDIRSGVLDGVLCKLECKEAKQAETLAQFRAAFDRLE